VLVFDTYTRGVLTPMGMSHLKIWGLDKWWYDPASQCDNQRVSKFLIFVTTSGFLQNSC